MKKEIEKVMPFFTDCIKCGQKTNKKELLKILKQIYKAGYFTGREDLKIIIEADFDKK
jgi:hypothetical protein